MKLRDYQNEAVEAIIASWRNHRSALVVLPTGCGKTVVFGEVIRRRLPQRTMVLAHREELVRQAQEKISLMTPGADVQIEMGEFTVTEMFGRAPDIVVSTVQTQNTGRMHGFEPQDFGCLVIDEAHHAPAASYRKCIDHYFENPECRLLGVTATPDRADEQALGKVFDTVAYEYTVTQAIDDGWLVPVRQRLVKVENLDLSGLHTVAGDLNQAELAEVLEDEKALHAIAAPTLQICGERRAIVFAASVRQAERLAEILNRSRPGRAAWLCGKTDRDERHRLLADFKAARLQFLVNVGVLTEGFDDAGVEVVVMARPTKSRALYAQMAGRATRPAADIASRLGDMPSPAARRELIASSAKPACLVVDFAGNSGRHKLVTSVDILGETDDDEELAEAVRERVRQRAGSSDGELDTAEELRKARAEVLADRERAAKRREFIRVTAKYREFSVDPFDLFDLPPVEPPPKAGIDRRHLSYRQRELLRTRIKVNPDDLNYAEAKTLIDEYFRRVKAGLATMAQSRQLRKFGVCVPMSFEEASRTLNYLLENRRHELRLA